MVNNIYPCIWYDGEANVASKFYTSLFKNSSILFDSPMVVKFMLDGVEIMGLNRGPMFQLNPSISMFVTCEEDTEIEILWSKLSEEGKILMDLDTYPWSEKYGWCSDRYGLTWQIYTGQMSEVNQKVVPAFLFANTQLGRAEEAVGFYTQTFKESKIEGIMKYGPEMPEFEGKVMHSQFILDNKVFMAMDGPGEHNFDFNEGFSFVVECKNQEEIDYYWNTFISNGGQESMCGWCKDKFGVFWQIIPDKLGTWMENTEKGERVMTALMKMKKLEYSVLENA